MNINTEDLYKMDNALDELPSEGRAMVLGYLKSVYELDDRYWVPIVAMKKKLSLSDQRIRMIVNKMADDGDVEAKKLGPRKLYRYIPRDRPTVEN